MNIRLDGKTALICGASQGIGKAIAEEFARGGANCILVSRNEVTLKDLVMELENNGLQNHNYIVADFSNYKSAISKIETFIKSINPIEILVNNTGGPKPGGLTKAHPDEFITAFSQHLIMNQLLVQSVLPNMITNHYGRIINIISMTVRQPLENLGVSNTVRGAVASWAKTLANEVGPFGVTVNNILPGYTLTSRLQSLFDRQSADSGRSQDEISGELKSTIPLRRFADPRETAYATVFLASDEAAYLTGVSLPVDGGFLRSI